MTNYAFYPQPPLVVTPIPYSFAYTPILIELVSPVLDASDQSLSIGAYPKVLKITSPSSRLQGAKQTFKTVSALRVPIDGIMRFKLVPSDLYVPRGDYKVELLEGGNQIPSDTFYWTVPYAPTPMTTEVVYTGDPNGDLITQQGVFELQAVSWAGTYSLVNNRLVWSDNPPLLNSTYNVTFQPAITVNQLRRDDHIVS